MFEGPIRRRCSAHFHLTPRGGLTVAYPLIIFKSFVPFLLQPFFTSLFASLLPCPTTREFLHHNLFCFHWVIFSLSLRIRVMVGASYLGAFQSTRAIYSYSSSLLP